MENYVELTQEEKEFLSAVIKPFKNRVEYIHKYKVNDDYERLYIKVSDDESNDECIMFPKFKMGTMYKGMERVRRYSIEDLNI